MSEKVVNKLSVANPTGLGLFGLAMVTFVAASQKLGITTGLSFVIVYAMFLGATAQLIASILDFLHENIWGATVFGAYAFFWYAVGTCWLMNMGALGPVLKGAVDIKQLGFAFLGYLIFSIFMTIGAMEVNKVIFADMVVIDVLLAGRVLQIDDPALEPGLTPRSHHVAGHVAAGEDDRSAHSDHGEVPASR